MPSENKEVNPEAFEKVAEIIPPALTIALENVAAEVIENIEKIEEEVPENDRDCETATTNERDNRENVEPDQEQVPAALPVARE